jgi:ATP/maltotriose-dependent transcriptional regulator MalT
LAHARELADDACRYARLAGDDAVLANALTRRIQVLDAEERLAALRQVTPLLSKVGNYFQLVVGYNLAAWYSLKEGRDHEALSLIDVAASAAAKGNQPRGSGMIWCGTLGQASLFTGDLERARQAFAEVLVLYARHGFHWAAKALSSTRKSDRATPHAERPLSHATRHDFEVASIGASGCLEPNQPRHHPRDTPRGSESEPRPARRRVPPIRHERNQGMSALLAAHSETVAVGTDRLAGVNWLLGEGGLVEARDATPP